MSPPRIEWIAAIVAVAVMCAGCGGGDNAAGGSGASASATRPGSDRVADDECDRTPASGARTQAAGGLRFTRGEVRVRVTPRRATPPQPRQGDDGDAAVGVCLGFDRWGDPNPLVPVDSVLLTFSDAAGSGVTVEVPLVELVSRRAEISGTVWVVGDGVRLQAPSCTVRPRAVTEREVSATFECADAMPVESNPFTPDDRIDPSDRSPETPAPPSPAFPQAPSAGFDSTAPATNAAALQGWFAVQQ